MTPLWALGLALALLGGIIAATVSGTIGIILVVAGFTLAALGGGGTPNIS